MSTTPLEAHLERQIEESQDFFWHRLRWDAVASRLPRGDGFELVDVGAGIGLVGDFLRTERPLAGYRYEEPIAALQEHLAERFGAEAEVPAGAPVPGARFVTLLDVLEHQPDGHAFLAGLAQRMASGATLILTVPALNRLWSDWDVALGHHTRYDKARLRTTLAALPFEVQELSYLFPEMLPAALARKRRRRDAEHAASADFPQLPSAVNEALYRAGRLTLALRRHWPAGTSLFAVLRRV